MIPVVIETSQLRSKGVRILDIKRLKSCLDQLVYAQGPFVRQ